MSRLQTTVTLLLILAAYGVVGTLDYQTEAAIAAERERNAAVALAERAVTTAEFYQAQCVAPALHAAAVIPAPQVTPQ